MIMRRWQTTKRQPTRSAASSRSRWRRSTEFLILAAGVATALVVQATPASADVTAAPAAASSAAKLAAVDLGALRSAGTTEGALGALLQDDAFADLLTEFEIDPVEWEAAVLSAGTPEQLSYLLHVDPDQTSTAGPILRTLQERPDYALFVSDATEALRASQEGSARANPFSIAAATIFVVLAAIGFVIACSAGAIGGPGPCLLATAVLVASILALLGEITDAGFVGLAKTQYCAYQASLYAADPTFTQGMAATFAACSRAANPFVGRSSAP